MSTVSKPERTWKVTAILVLIFAAVASCLTIENHVERTTQEEKPAAIITGRTLVISNESKRELVAFMKKEKSIIGVSTISISLVRNSRESTFFDSEDEDFKREWYAYKAKHSPPPLVFTQDAHSNSRITKIINGNFECRKTAETIIPKLYDAPKYAPMTCSISVPAGFDKSADFVGYINFFIKDEVLTDSERLRLAKSAVDISTHIYNRDFKSQDTQ